MTAKIKTFESVEAWQDRARELFGDNPLKWKFVCPACNHVATPEDFVEVGASMDTARCECIGRHLDKSKVKGAFDNGKGPCDYAGYGLIRLSPVRVKDGENEVHSFAFEGDDQ